MYCGPIKMFGQTELEVCQEDIHSFRTYQLTGVIIIVAIDRLFKSLGSNLRL
jgi:hypothetical protein